MTSAATRSTSLPGCRCAAGFRSCRAGGRHTSGEFIRSPRESIHLAADGSRNNSSTGASGRCLRTRPTRAARHFLWAKDLPQPPPPWRKRPAPQSANPARRSNWRNASSPKPKNLLNGRCPGPTLVQISRPAQPATQAAPTLLLPAPMKPTTARTPGTDAGLLSDGPPGQCSCRQIAGPNQPPPPTSLSLGF
jgi:hypothetical protein